MSSSRLASWLGTAVLIGVLLASAQAAARNGVTALRPSDTSSPRATLQGFIAVTDDIYTQMKDVLESYSRSDRLYPTDEERAKQRDILADVPHAMDFLDISNIPPVLRDTVTVERLLQSKEVLDRIDLPATASIPDRAAMVQAGAKRWRIPDTEIDLVLMENGPRAGEYLFSAATLDRLPGVYQRVSQLPYQDGPARELHEVYKKVSLGGTGTIYEAFLSSPVGLSHVVPIRWLLRLPPWVKTSVAGVAIWQWFGLLTGVLLGALILRVGYRLGRSRDTAPGGVSTPRWRKLSLPLAILFVAGMLIPFVCAILRIGGDARIAIDYMQTVVVFLTAAWLVIVVSMIAGEAFIASEHLTSRSLDSQLIRLGTRLVGMVAAIGILIHGGDEVGFPAYSVLAGLGVGGLAVALAARDTIANLIGSLLITVEKPFRVGHVVRVSGSEGTVEDVGFRSTRIRTLDNSLVSIPSSTVVNTTVENLTLRTKRRQKFFVQLTYDTSRETIEDLVSRIRQLIIDHPLAEESTCQVRLNNFAESSLDILVIFYLYVADYTSELTERESILLRIMDLVGECGAEFAYPTRTLHVEPAQWQRAAPVLQSASVASPRRVAQVPAHHSAERTLP